MIKKSLTMNSLTLQKILINNKKNVDKKNNIKILHNKILNERLLTKKTNDTSVYNKIIVFVTYCDLYKDYIKDCLISISEQNYTNYDVYIVNDGAINIKIIDDFIINRKNYKILNKKNNEGAASSRWEFINYIQNNITNFSYNDIVIFIDGDDYLIGNDVFLLINNKYLDTKCWLAFSDYHGIFSEEITQKFIIQKKNNTNIRINKSIYFPPLRTCKLGLLKYIKKDVFMINNEYIQKASDVALFTTLYELCGNEKTEYINNKIYYYREHNNNSYKKISDSYKNDVLTYIYNYPIQKQISNFIHVILVTYKRNVTLESIFKMLISQTKHNNIILHLLDNNVDKTLNNEIDNIINKYKNNINIKLYRFNYNYHCYSRIILVQKIIKENLIDYIIIFDDDQIYENDWFSKINKIAKPNTIYSWYGKIFSEKNYLKSTITFGDIISKKNEEIKYYKYFGPGGCIIDCSLFLYNKIYDFDNYNEYSESIIKIDDIWMSFIFNKYLNIQFNRFFKTPIKFLEDKTYSTFSSIKNEKQDLFCYLIDNYNWNIYDKNNYMTINKYFDIIYILNNETLYLRNKVNKLNLNILFTNKNIRNIFDDIIKHNYKKILIIYNNKYIINDNINDNINEIFNNIYKKFDNNWNIIKFDNCAVGLKLDIIKSIKDNITIIEDIYKSNYITVNNNLFIKNNNKLVNIFTRFKNLNINLDYNYNVIKCITDIDKNYNGYIIILNNDKNIYFDKNIINKLIYKIEKNNTEIEYGDEISITYFDNNNYDMYIKYNKLQNKNIKKSTNAIIYKNYESYEKYNKNIVFNNDKIVIIL